MSKKKREGIHYEETAKYPCSPRTFKNYEKIITGLENLPYEHLVVVLESYPNHLEFVQTTRDGVDDLYLIEVGVNPGFST